MLKDLSITPLCRFHDFVLNFKLLPEGILMQVSVCAQGVSRFLDRAEAADRVAIRAHAQQAQYDEYDDEYDDSYDDLGGPSADGVADVEGWIHLSMHRHPPHIYPPAPECADCYSTQMGQHSQPLHRRRGTIVWVECMCALNMLRKTEAAWLYCRRRC